MSIASGTRLGPYEILAPLGAGGMGEVYRARDTRLGREVALKILPSEFSSNQDRLARFEQEARAASSLNHPNIITIYDIGSIDSTTYLCMELVEGKSLRDVLDEGSIPVRRIVSIVCQLADGLAKAHAAGIVHRDLKPENLMISKDGFLKILDFGLAKRTHAPDGKASKLQTQTGAGMVLGTVGYMSPEQASGKPIDFHSDQFSFGTILYEMITGKRPFQRATSAETMAAIIREDAEPVSALNPQTPAVLRWIMERCMAKDSEERYASTRDLARDLQGIRDHISEVTGSVETLSAVSQPATKRSPFAVSVLLLIAFLAGAALTYWFVQPKAQEPLKMITLTYSGKDSSPAVSPDGKLIAFRSDRDGKPRIWLKQLAGGNEVVLTSGPDDYPRFSPDGSTILFIRTQGAVTSLFRIPVLGGEDRKILDDVQSADCSPDGKRIAFFRWKAGDSSLNMMAVDGASVQELAIFKKKLLQFPRWSPDGNRIVAIRSLAGNAANIDSILIIDMRTTEQRWIRSTWPTVAVWADSGNQILYDLSQSATGVAGARTSGTIVLQDVNSQKLRPLFWFPSSGDILDLVDRNRIVLHSFSSRQNLRQIALTDKPLEPTRRQFTQGNSIDRQPVYSPDGKQILFSSTGSGNLDLWVMSAGSGALRRITDDATDDWDPAYTRDGKHILWSSNRGGHFEIWMANADGSGSHQITNDGFDAENPTITPDGRWIAYNSYTPEKRGVWKIHPDGSGATLLVSGLTQYPEISPDGVHVAFLSYKESNVDPTAYINVVDIATGAPVSFQVKAANGRCRWMPDGKAIAYIDQNERGEFGVFVQDFIPGKDTYSTRRPAAGFDPNKLAESLGISPDGSFLMLSEAEVLSSLILAENVPGLPPRTP
jgi:serine/threonine protein kinase